MFMGGSILEAYPQGELNPVQGTTRELGSNIKWDLPGPGQRRTDEAEGDLADKKGPNRNTWFPVQSLNPPSSPEASG